MKIITQDYRSYIQDMEYKDCCLIDPPWIYKDSPRALVKQLNYNLIQSISQQFSPFFFFFFA